MYIQYIYTHIYLFVYSVQHLNINININTNINIKSHQIMAEPTFHTYHGNCHCGAFKFSVQLPELKEAHACNCSICSKVSLITFYFS